MELLRRASAASCRAALAALCVAAAVPAAAAQDAPQAETALVNKAYLVVVGTVTDREAFRENYAKKLPPLYEKFGGVYLAAGRNIEILEGSLEAASYVLAEFPSMEAARAFWTSPEYQALQKARQDGKWGSFTVFLIEGIPPSTVAPLAREPAKAP
jgi:uncharacterized protein (DUF1330 family)